MGTGVRRRFRQQAAPSDQGGAGDWNVTAAGYFSDHNPVRLAWCIYMTLALADSKPPGITTNSKTSKFMKRYVKYNIKTVETPNPNYVIQDYQFNSSSFHHWPPRVHRWNFIISSSTPLKTSSTKFHQFIISSLTPLKNFIDEISSFHHDPLNRLHRWSFDAWC